MYYLISGSEILGTSNYKPEDLSEDYTIVETEEIIDREEFYYNGSALIKKPSKPNDTSYWSYETNSWILGIEISPIEPIKTANWELLIDRLRNSPLWLKIRNAGKKTNAANFAVTLLFRALDTSRSEEDLGLAIQELREALISSSQLQDFTPPEIEFINSKLQEAEFKLRID